MRTVATNLALNHVTRADQKLTDTVGDFSTSEVYLPTETLETQIESNERFQTLCRAVRTLPLQCRRVFILKKVYGMSQKEIAKYLDISQSTVEKHVAKGLSRCHEYMDEMGYRVELQSGRSSPIAQTKEKGS